MPTLTPAQLAAARREILTPADVSTTKPPLNTAIQEVEDALPLAFQSLVQSISGPWTLAQKRRIARVVLTQRVLDLAGG